METKVRVRHRTRPLPIASSSEAQGEGATAHREAPDKAPEDYEVGYGKPPRHTRFQPGQSGNPKGRPKGSKNLKTLIDRELNEKVAVREGGRRQQVSKREVVAKQLVNKAVDGQDRAILTLIKLNEELEAAVKAEAASGGVMQPDEPLGEDDHAILAALEAQILEKHGQSSSEVADRATSDATEDEEAPE
ncbi:MAG: DUF5681 domain-containing protein [Planctomycetota bacterium]|jgi:hypothetical protein